MTLRLLLRLHPPQGCRLLTHGGGDQPHARALRIIERYLHVQAAVTTQQPREFQGFIRLHITIDRSGFMPVDEVRAGALMTPHLTDAEVAPVTQHEVARAQFEFRRGADIVLAVGVDAEGLEAHVFEVA